VVGLLAFLLIRVKKQTSGKRSDAESETESLFSKYELSTE
jgi:hypothetical protein